MAQFHPARTLIITVFTLAIMVLYAMLHTAIGIYIKSVFGINIGWYLWVLGVSSIFCWILSHWKRTSLTHLYYIIGTVWMGVAFISFLVFFPLLMVRKYFDTALYPEFAIPLVVILLLSGFYAAYVPKTKFFSLAIRNLPKTKKPIRLVHITDPHIGEIYGPKHLQRTVDKVNVLDADYVVITGDLFDGAGKIYSGMIDPIRNIQSKHPALFVTGNHEVYEGVDRCIRMVKEQGVTVLDDETISLGGLQFIGVSYPANYTDKKKDVLRRLAKRLDHAKPRILLRHEPRSLEDSAALGIDLQLSGHTHNGQIWPLSYMINLFYEFRVGLHKKGVTTIYISPGTATWGPPFRIGSRSEITVFELIRA